MLVDNARLAIRHDIKRILRVAGMLQSILVYGDDQFPLRVAVRVAHHDKPVPVRRRDHDATVNGTEVHPGQVDANVLLCREGVHRLDGQRTDAGDHRRLFRLWYSG